MDKYTRYMSFSLPLTAKIIYVFTPVVMPGVAS